MFWKLLAVTDCAFASWKVYLVLSLHTLNRASCAFVALHVAVAVGLVGYAWGARIGKPFVWAIVALMYVLTDMSTVAGAYLAMTLFDHGQLGEQRTMVFCSLAMMATYALVKTYALCRYSRRTLMPWAEAR